MKIKSYNRFDTKYYFKTSGIFILKIIFLKGIVVYRSRIWTYFLQNLCFPCFPILGKGKNMSIFCLYMDRRIFHRFIVKWTVYWNIYIHLISSLIIQLAIDTRRSPWNFKNSSEKNCLFWGQSIQLNCPCWMSV